MKSPQWCTVYKAILVLVLFLLEKAIKQKSGKNKPTNEEWQEETRNMSSKKRHFSWAFTCFSM